MSTLAQLRDETFRNLGDGPQGGFYSVAEVNLALNHAQRAFQLLTLQATKLATVTVSAAETSLSISDLLVVRSVTRDSDKQRLFPVRWEQIAQYLDPAAAGSPTVYALQGYKMLTVHPAPTSAMLLRVLYSPEPPLMVNDADQCFFPHSEESMVDFATWFCSLKEGGSGLMRAQVNLQRFLAEAKATAEQCRIRTRSYQWDMGPAEFRAWEKSRLVFPPKESSWSAPTP